MHTLCSAVRQLLPTSIDLEARTNQLTHLLIEIPQPTNFHELVTDARNRSKITMNDTNLRLQYIPTGVEYVHLHFLFRTIRDNLVILFITNIVTNIKYYTSQMCE